MISRYMKIRKALIEIRIAVGLPDKAKLEDIVAAVKELVARDGEKKDKRAEP